MTIPIDNYANIYLSLRGGMTKQSIDIGLYSCGLKITSLRS